MLPSVPDWWRRESSMETKQCAQIMDRLSSLFCLQWVTEDSKPSRRTRGCSQGNLQVRPFLFWWIASQIALKCFYVAPKAAATSRYQNSSPDQISFLCRGAVWGVEGSRLEAWIKSHKSEVAIISICTPTSQETVSVLEKTQANKTFRTWKQM